MAGTLTLTDKQLAPAGVTLLDEDGQKIEILPSDYVVTFESSNPAVAEFEVGPDGMNGEVTSGKVGSSVITATVTFPDGTVKSDTISVSVLNTAPASVNFTAGEPLPE